MQKITINNFGAIKSAEIEVKKVLVLIGEQASGKSTIAKLIYFFTSLKDKSSLSDQLFQDIHSIYDDVDSDFLCSIRKKFYDLFGLVSHSSDFEITFHYSIEKNKYIQLINNNKKLNVQCSDNFFDADFKSKFKSYAEAIKGNLQKSLNTREFDKNLYYEKIYIEYFQKLSKLSNEAFERHQLDSLLFVIASRNVTVSYSELFEQYLLTNRQRSLEGQHKEQTIDEALMFNFIERVQEVKKIFKKYGSFEALIELHAQNESVKQNLKRIENKIHEILKGKYFIDNYGEKIVVNTETEEYVYLHNTSSGQQESIRILQDIFISILDDSKTSRIIEEPEAHLFPVAQKQLIELLCLMVNHNVENQLIITTHSPYVLTVFNNLLFAKRVVEKNPSAKAEVTQVIPQDCWLNAKDFSAYSLGNQYFDEETNYCESIFNTERGTIKQNYLDTVSEILGSDFDKLYSIHAKTFARR